jgi:hypothetical protein
MGTLVTLVVGVLLLLVVARLTWPRNARAPMPLYVGTITGAFLIGLFAGSMAEGRGLERSLQSALILGPVIGVVAGISWFRVKAPESPPDPPVGRGRAGR